MNDNISWNKALDRLKSGNTNFVGNRIDGVLGNFKTTQELEAGQSPYAIIVSCADSRVVPELVFDAGLGEIFVIRVAGNIANTSTVASLEYAVAHLSVNLIVVLGHENCGAVSAAIQGGDNGHNLNHLLCHITPALHASESKALNDVVKVNAQITCKEIQSKSVIVQNAIESGNLKLRSAFYNLASGKVDFIEG